MWYCNNRGWIYYLETLYNKLNTTAIITAKNQLENIKNLKKDNIINTLSLNQLNKNSIKKYYYKQKI